MEERSHQSARGCRGSLPPLLLALVLASVPGAARAGSFKYLGCYGDSAVRDLGGRDLSFSTLTLDVCAAQCSAAGFPFLGLQFGSRCFCGATYGFYGPSTACNSTCGPTYCGGYLANDVYYSVDSSQAAQRSLVVQPSALPWTQARALCVSAGGDLATVDTLAALQAVISAAEGAARDEAGNGTAAGASTTSVWVGLHQSAISGQYEWTDENLELFQQHPQDYVSYWSNATRVQSGCVSVNLSTSGPYFSWTSVDCSSALPFVCNQRPPPPVTNSTTYPTIATVSPGGLSSSSKQLALYIVLPVFFFCYGGSCILYCSYKIYKHCRTTGGRDNKMQLGGPHYPPLPRPPQQAPFAQPLARTHGRPKYQHEMDGGKGGAVYPLVAPQPMYFGGSDDINHKMAAAGSKSEGGASTFIDMKSLDGGDGNNLGAKVPLPGVKITPPESKTPPPNYDDMRNDSRARLLENVAQQARERRAGREAEANLGAGIESTPGPVSAGMECKNPAPLSTTDKSPSSSIPAIPPTGSTPKDRGKEAASGKEKGKNLANGGGGGAVAGGGPQDMRPDSISSILLKKLETKQKK